MRILALFAAIVCCTVPCEGENRLVPAATLDLDQFFAPDPGKHARRTNVLFRTDSEIVVGACTSGDCMLLLAKWDGSALRSFAQTHEFSGGTAIQVTEQGGILTLSDGDSHAYLYSPDLLTKVDVSHLQKASATGNTVAEWKWQEHQWNLYRMTTAVEIKSETEAGTKSGTKSSSSLQPKLELIRQTTGDLRSLTDEVAVFLGDDGVRTETLQGQVLGSLKTRMWCHNDVGVGGNELYLHDCRAYRVVDFHGKERLKVRVPRGLSQSVAWSADRKRALVDVFSRTNTAAVGWAGIAGAIVALGVDQAPTNERVRVTDTATGKACFDLRRSFPEGSESAGVNAALSPSGQFVTMVDRGTISVYRMPEGCK